MRDTEGRMEADDIVNTRALITKGVKCIDGDLTVRAK